jgi:tRNA dimethylallyltransferase
MLENGLLNEAKKAFELKVSSGAAQAIGHKELFPFFAGEITLEQAVENLKQVTRRYAKRQLTWFRRNSSVNWYNWKEFPVFSDALAFSTKIAHSCGLQ